MREPQSREPLPRRGVRETTRVAEHESIATGVAGRYALALFALAQEQRSTDKVAADLHNFDAMIAGSADMQRLVRSPVFTAQEQTKAINKVLEKAGISGIAANFIRLVAAKRRLFAIRDMIKTYGALNDAAKGVARAEVTAAHDLNDSQLDALKAQLGEITHGKSVEVAVKVDPSIIGGLIVKLGSRMVDGSIRTKLNSIRSRMKEAG
jgi:F-type H+-transporting ATPase subunit delta